MKRIGCLSVLVFVLLLFVVPLFFTSEHLRYRLTIEIETPRGVVSNSSVIGVWRHWGAWFDPFKGNQSWRVKGEGVYVDLGAGPNGKPQHVIAILANGTKGQGVDWSSQVYRAVLGTNRPVTTSDSMGQARARAGQKIDLPFPNQPTLVTFTDISDPATAKVVRGENVTYVTPAGGGQQSEQRTAIDEIAATFGPGHAFRRATVEIVPAGIWPFNLISAPWPQWLFGTPITRGIEAKLPWWHGPNRPAAIAARASGLPLGAIDVESFFIRGF